MTGADFHKWVAEPAILDRDSLQQLKKLTARYPFFVSAQLLLAKNLKLEHHIDQRRQLHLAAIHVSERKLLFALMEGTHPLQKAKVDALQVHFEKQEFRNEVSDIEEFENAVEAMLPTFSDAFSAVESVEIVEDVNINTVVTEVAEIEFSALYQEPDCIDEGAKMPQDVPESRQSLYDLIPEPLIYRIEDAALPEQPIVGQETEPSELVFDQWLARLARGKAAKETVPDISLSSVIPRQTQGKDNLALIADFLASHSKDSTSQRAEFYKPSKAAQRSNQQEFSIISETLATIYEQQGKYELAIKAFDALEVKYPEKSSYFAARKTAAQEKLSGLLNS